MNLSQIATIVGQRLGVAASDSTTRDGAAVRAFLQMRHDQLFRSFLWRDSIIEFQINVNPLNSYNASSNYMPTKGRVILPPIFQHVLGVRLGWMALDIQRPMLYYRADFGRFYDSSYAQDYTLLPSCVWESDTSVPFTVATNSAVDAGNNLSVTADVLQTDGVSVVRGAYALSTTPVAIATTDTIETLIKPAYATGVGVSGTVTLYANGLAVSNLAGGATGDIVAPKCQRIQIVGKPANVGQNPYLMKILGKRNTPSFSAETDTPAINGLDGILIALAYYDFKQRDEAGGSADATTALAEAVGPEFLVNGKPGGFLNKLIEEEVLQAAYNCRIIPETGFGGDEYFDQPYGSKYTPYF